MRIPGWFRAGSAAAVWAVLALGGPGPAIAAPSDVDGLTGFYRMGPHATLRIADQGGTLTAQVDGQRFQDLGAAPVMLRQSSPAAFVVDGHAATRLRFDLGNDGKASVVTVTDGRRTARAVRVAD